MVELDQLPASPSARRWRGFYRTAISEKDSGKVQFCIAEAEGALILRGRELLSMSADTSEEAAALDDALYALRALRNCLRFKTHEVKVA